MHHSTALSALAFGASVMGQQAGTSTAEDPPLMPLSRCTDSGCTEEDHSVTLDANWRWTHSVDGYTNCYTGNTWDDSLCPDGETCAQNCAVDGADYSGTYGISAQDGALSLTLKTGSNVGSRVYLLGEGGENYEMFDLRNKEFAFDVDVSSLPCGVNGALYFVEMDADGGLSEYENNKAGAKYGTGYCDAQCPQDIKYINGKSNVEGWTPSDGDPNSGTGSMGSCCNEMDIWEANSISTALTPHVCKKDGQTACESDTACGVGDARNDGVCDKDGCDFNPFRMGNESFYGDGKIIDTSSKITVVTQFITGDNSDTGELTEIKRIYKQNGNVIQQATSNVEGVSGNSITDDFCKAQKDAFGDPTSFESRGGLSAMGDAFSRGMVLVMSIWVDYAANMHWLDAPYPEDADKSEPGVARGTCSTDSGVPDDVISQSGDATVTFSNIKVGAIDSTY
ncbi:putative 1,4-beta-D-glucan cellobiohydrolase [Hortaea werneckii]|nr:putative 1,4-beta-D-glucan cellobiohydrolase [Hortaea werneckii]